MLRQSKVRLEHGRKTDDGWTKGKAFCNGRVYDFVVKHYDEPSDYGIDNGRISKLWLREVGKMESLLNYDRGWERGYTPNTPRPDKANIMEIYKALLARFN